MTLVGSEQYSSAMPSPTAQKQRSWMRLYSEHSHISSAKQSLLSGSRWNARKPTMFGWHI